MAIKKQSLIEYSDMLNYVYDNIKSTCKNIDVIASDIDSKLKYGTVYNIGNSVTVAGNNYKAAGSQMIVNATVIDTMLNAAVPMSTVKNQLTAFLDSKGLSTKKEQIVNFRNMMYFYNNVAAFLATKIVYITSVFGNAKVYAIYDQSKTNFPTVNLGASFDKPEYNDERARSTDALVNKSNVITSVQDMMAGVNMTSRIHYAKTTLTFTSSSSSSSMFIAYMNI